jgi:hypothetical protein
MAMHKWLAIAGMAVALPLGATPCSTVDRALTAAQKHAWSPAIARQLRVPNIDVLQVFHQDHWRIIYVDTHRSDNGFLFYRDDPLHSRYITLWAGVAQSDEEASIEQWTVTNVPGIPSDLAQCFAWYVTQHRDM